MPPHRLRRAALHLLPRRSERGLLYFHHGLLAAVSGSAADRRQGWCRWFRARSAGIWPHGPVVAKSDKFHSLEMAFEEVCRVRKISPNATSGQLSGIEALKPATNPDFSLETFHSVLTF